MNTNWWRMACGLVAVIGMASLAPALKATGQQQQFDEARIFLELNDTDGDLGLHAEIDGEPWTELAIVGPRGTQLLSLISQAALRAQGLTQLSFESAEPSFEELPPAEFLARFPAGVYRVVGRLSEGGRAENTTTLSHVLAAPPSDVTVSGQPAAASCDSQNLPVVSGPVTIDWSPVTSSHRSVGRPGPLEIERYQFFVERGASRLAVDLPSDVTEFAIPASLTAASGEYKFEIIARTSTGNNTAIETCFVARSSGCAVPTAPAGATGRITNRTGTLQWAPVAGANSYIVQAGSAPGLSDYFNGNVGNVITASAANLPPGFRTYVRIIAINGCGQSTPSGDVLVQ